MKKKPLPELKPNEIEITPEMIDAGEEALIGAEIWPPDHRRDFAVWVYRAMVACNPKARRPSGKRSVPD